MDFSKGAVSQGVPSRQTHLHECGIAFAFEPAIIIINMIIWIVIVSIKLPQLTF